MPRALALAWIYVAHSDSTVAAQSFKAVVEGFQSIEPMKIGELWALPSLLRFVLIENLRRIAVRVNRRAPDAPDRQRGRRQGACDARRRGPTAMLADYAAHARDTTFATQLALPPARRLAEFRQGADTGWRRSWRSRGTDAEEIIIGEHHTLSSGNVTTGNIVRGLRLINDVDWTVWFEDVSRIDALLRERSDVASLDFASRDQYRQAIEDLARRSKLSEFEVADGHRTEALGAGR